MGLGGSGPKSPNSAPNVVKGKYQRMQTAAPRQVADSTEHSKIALLPDLDIPDRWDDLVCGMEPRRFKKMAALFAVLVTLACILGAYIFFFTGNVPVPPISAQPPYNVTARLRTSVLIEGYSTKDFGEDENPERFRWAMSKYLKLPAEAVEIVSWADRDWQLFQAQGEWDAQLTATPPPPPPRTVNGTTEAEGNSTGGGGGGSPGGGGVGGRRRGLLSSLFYFSPAVVEDRGTGGDLGSDGGGGMPIAATRGKDPKWASAVVGGRRMLLLSTASSTRGRRRLSQLVDSTYPFVNVTYEILAANATAATAARTAVLDLVYSVAGAGNQRLKGELYAMGMKDVLSVLGSRKPFDWTWPPPPLPPPPPRPPPSPPFPPPGVKPPQNTTATNATAAGGR